MKFYIVLIFAATLSISCSPKELKTWEFEDSLVFVEGKELLAGRFGDIILLDKTSDSIIKVTNDSYYDSDPFFIKDDAIAFISKRRKKDLGAGLAKNDDVYLFDLEKRTLSLEINGGNEPIFVNENLSVLYYTRFVDYKDKLFSKSYDSNNPEKLLSNYLPKLFIKFAVSANEKYSLYEYMGFFDGEYEITLMFYDLESGKEEEFLKKISLKMMIQYLKRLVL